MLHLLKRELAIPTVGFNTNAILIGRLTPMVAEGLIDRLVIGLDYVDGRVSKHSPIGVSSRTILATILALKRAGQDIAIAAVYNGDYLRFEKLVNWCLANDVTLKVLEVSDDKIACRTTKLFTRMISQTIERFSLDLAEIPAVGDYYGMKGGVPRIYFFHSHCRLRECGLCG